MNLTKNRIFILKQLVDKQYLTSSDFYKLLSGSERGIRRVLTDFTKHGYIQRRPLVHDKSFEGRVVHWEYIYWLTQKGVQKARELDLDPKRIGKANDEKSPHSLPHDRLVVDFRLRLEASCGGIWWRQHGLYHDFHRGRVNPDALFYLAPYYYFLEIERSKQGKYIDGKSELMRKVEGYLAYADASQRSYQEKWPSIRGFFVLFVVKNAVRRDNFVKKLKHAYPYRLYWVGTQGDVEHNLLGDIWHSPQGVHSFPREE